MVLATNQWESIVNVGFPYRIPGTATSPPSYGQTGQLLTVFGGQITHGGSAAFLVHLMAMVNQMWTQMFDALQPPLLGVSSAVSGDGFFAFAEPVTAVGFRAVQIPSWTDRIAAVSPRYPHLGDLAWVYTLGDGIVSRTRHERIEYASQMFFPSGYHPAGMYYRLCPGVFGYFITMGQGNKFNSLEYTYPVAEGIPVVRHCNPFMGDVAFPDDAHQPVSDQWAP